MNTTVLGFASVITCGIVLAPFLVQTDQVSTQAFEPPAVTMSVCSQGAGGPDASRLPALSDCPSPTAFRIAEAR